MKCKKCGKGHDGSFGSGKFCSRACANSRIRTEETKKKISEGVLKSEWWLNCDYGHNSFPEKIEKQKRTWKSKRDYNSAHIWSIKKWIKEERGNRCEECGISDWLGKPISMEVDHIDGDTNNNDLSNLKVLCPNCHSQTPTWRRKKK
jgi:hypothetical protein